MLYAAVIVTGCVSLAVLSLLMAARDADGMIESSREDREMARFAEPYIEIRCEVQGACRLAFTREEWAEMSDAERDRAVRDAALIGAGATVTWRYTPVEREGAAR